MFFSNIIKKKKMLKQTILEIEETLELKQIELTLKHNEDISLQKIDSKHMILFCYNVKTYNLSRDIITFIIRKTKSSKDDSTFEIININNKKYHFDNKEAFIKFIMEEIC